MGDEQLSVIVPCLDEVDNIGATVHDILTVAQTLPLPVTVWMVDDGSTDGTADRMRALCRADSRCRMRINPDNRGIGRSVTETYRELPAGTWVTVIPGDAEFRFDSIRAFLDVRAQYDLILGYFRNPMIRSVKRRLGSFAFNQLAGVLYGYSFRYLNGMKLYRLEVLDGIEVRSSGFAYNSELLAKALLRRPDLRIGEVPFIARGRSTGSSHAFRPRAMTKAAVELARGFSAVNAYRERVIAAQGLPHQEGEE